MLRDAFGAIQRWQYRGGKPQRWTLLANVFAAGISPNGMAKLEAPGARPFFPIDRRAPVTEFERIVDQYPVFRIA
jgi:hypothetical protein